MNSLLLDRLMHLPLRPQETWQGGFVRLPGWVRGEDHTPYRPFMPVWISLGTARAYPGEPCRPQEKNFGMVLSALVNFACDRQMAGYRPGRLEVSDSALAEHLAGTLAQAGIRVAHRQGLPLVERLIQEMTTAMGGADPTPGLTATRGVDLVRVRSFAQAAESFYQAAPWRRLTDEDLIQVQSPLAEDGLQYATVLGAGGQTYGLGFFTSPQEHWRMSGAGASPGTFWWGRRRGVWLLSFDPITELPLKDSDLWLEHDLPVAGPEAYPCPICFKPGQALRRPSAKVMAFMEGLLRALASADDAAIDSGCWRTHVATAEGPVEFTLTLPDLLHPPAAAELLRRGLKPDPRAMERVLVGLQGSSLSGDSSTDSRPRLEEAQDLCYQAYQARGRRRVHLARAALAASPDCAEAYVILAEQAGDLERAALLYQAGMDVGQRVLGPQTMDRGGLWGLLAGRSYLRCRMGLARSGADCGDLAGAVEHYRELLRLDGQDHHQVRYLLLPALIQLGHDQEARSLLDRFMAEEGPDWLYGRALVTYRACGDCPEARGAIGVALKSRPAVAQCLLEGAQGAGAGAVASHEADEASRNCAEAMLEAFQATPGALQWLAGQNGSPRSKV